MHFDAREITTMLTMVFVSLFALFSIPEIEIVHSIRFIMPLKNIFLPQLHCVVLSRARLVVDCCVGRYYFDNHFKVIL